MDISGLTSSSSIPAVSAFILGVMAAIGPCTMATNIAALAYVSRRPSDRKYGVLAGLLYTLGRMLTYSVLGTLIILTGLEIPAVSMFLQGIGEVVLGPFLIAVGLLMLFADRINLGGAGNFLAEAGKKVADWGLVGAFLLGALFALAFCPYSAVLFFAVLIPLSLKTQGGIFLPAVFAIGTGLPVLLFGMLISFGVSGVPGWVNAVSRAEKILRIAVAVAFIGTGIYCMIPWIAGLFA